MREKELLELIASSSILVIPLGPINLSPSNSTQLFFGPHKHLFARF